MNLPGWFRRLPLPTPLKHLAGSAWMMAGRLFAMGMIAGFGLAVFAGLLSAIDSVFASRDAAYAEGRLADLELRVVADDVANFPDFRSLPGVADVRLRMVYPGSASLKPQEPALRILVIADADAARTPINERRLLEGRGLDPADRDGVVVERSLARFHGVKPGDRLRVKLGKEMLDFEVRGIAADAEFLLAPANPSLFVPSKGSLGVVYANPQALAQRFGFVPANSVLVRAAAKADTEALRQAVIQRAQTRLNVDGTTLQHEQFSHRFLEKNLGLFRIIVPVIVLVSVLSAVFVTSFLLVQWVENERQTLAVLLTLGHSPGWLAACFAAMALYLAGGVVLGGLAFAVFVGQGFIENYAGALGMPVPELHLGAAHMALGVAGVLAVFAVACGFAMARIFALAPRDAMRGGVARAAAPDRLGGAVGAWAPHRLLRIPLRSLLRHRAISAVCVVAVALGFGITSAFFISYSSILASSIRMVEGGSWDLAVDFNAPVWEEDVTRIVRDAGLREWTPYIKGIAQGLSGDGKRRVNLYAGGFDPDKPWFPVMLTAGENLSAAAPAGILLESSAARELGVGVGSPLVVEMLGRRHQAVVRGLFSGAMPGEARFTLAFARELGDLADRSTGLFVRSREDLEALARRLQAQPDVQQVLSKPQITREILAASGQVTEIVRLGAAIAIAIAALFVFACIGYTVLRQRREFQTLRLLGYRDGIVTAMIAVQIGCLGLLAMLLAGPIGALVADVLNQRVSASWYQVDTVIGAADYARSALLGFVLLPLVAIPVARSVLRVPLEQELRSREIA